MVTFRGIVAKPIRLNLEIPTSQSIEKGISGEVSQILELLKISCRYGFHLHQNMPYSEITGSVGVCPDINSDVSLATDILNVSYSFILLLLCNYVIIK